MGIGIEGRTARAPGTLPHLRADVFRVSGLRVLRFRVLFFFIVPFSSRRSGKWIPAGRKRAAVCSL